MLSLSLSIPAPRTTGTSVPPSEYNCARVGDFLVLVSTWIVVSLSGRSACCAWAGRPPLSSSKAPAGSRVQIESTNGAVCWRRVENMAVYSADEKGARIGR